jgi:ferredoxin-NADP reductase
MDSQLLKKQKVAADAYSFYFKKLEGFNFAPGQYLRMEIEIQNPDVRGNSRLFTIAASPTEEDLMITTRVIQSSFKKTLEQMRPETPVKIFGPYGTFVLKEEEKQPHIFLAGGIGITPLRSMIRYALDKNLTIPITLFTSFKTPDDIVFSEMLRNIKTDWFKLVETVTRPEESKTPWSGLTGRIDADLIKKNVSDLNNSIFYISGPTAMVDALTETVRTLNIPQDNIRVEKFTGY